MQFDLVRDFLDALNVTHPKPTEGQAEVKANVGIRFLPSSPDKTMHTAQVQVTLSLDDPQQPFVNGLWRFMIRSDEACEIEEHKGDMFFNQILAHGATKVLIQVNNLCMHANMPIIPLDGQQLLAQVQAGENPQQN